MAVDAGLLEDVLWHIHNWFVRETLYVSDATIENGELPASITNKLQTGMWYRIQGSYLNDGLHQHPDTHLAAENPFDAEISLLAIPKPLLKVVERIAEWIVNNKSAADSPFTSESFGGYSYTLKDGISADSGSDGLSGWRLEFRDDLTPWRKIS